MKSFDFDAVVYDGAEYCVECCPVDVDSDDVSPIFADAEMDRSVVCDACGAEHDYMTILESDDDPGAEDDCDVCGGDGMGGGCYRCGKPCGECDGRGCRTCGDCPDCGGRGCGGSDGCENYEGTDDV